MKSIIFCVTHCDLARLLRFPEKGNARLLVKGRKGEQSADADDLRLIDDGQVKILLAEGTQASFKGTEVSLPVGMDQDHAVAGSHFRINAKV